MNKKLFKKLGDAIALASLEFREKIDKQGVPYVIHCLHVMNAVAIRSDDDPEMMTIAVLHDLIEDTAWTFSELTAHGYSDRVVNALHLLTHESDVDYIDYITHISSSKDAIIVKMADLTHNLDVNRLKGLTPKDFDRTKKYQRSYTILKDQLEVIKTTERDNLTKLR